MPARLTPPLPHFSFLWVLLLGCLALAACHGTEPSAQPSSTATLAPTPTATPAALASLISGEQAYQHLLVLSEDIGSRPAGSDAERQAAQYISQQLTTYGYQTEVQEFTSRYYVEEPSVLEVVLPTPLSLDPSALRLSASGEVTAELVSAGLGRPQDFPPEGSKGRIALIERGELSFADKVTNAAANGAAAVIIYNNVEGPFQGELQKESPIPALSLSQAEGRQLQALLAEGPLTVHLLAKSGQETKTSQNVIARPPQDDCRVIVGAHYDSVAAGPGANDNASGSATLLEIARVLDLRGQEEGVCFVAFGAEETGLFGSRHFVASLASQDQPSPQAMVNLDMVGVGNEWQLMGSPSLVEKIDQGAAALGLDPVPIESSLESDHISFTDAGIPAILIYRFEDPHQHTEYDRAEFVQPQLLEEAAKLTLLALDELPSH
ncbi:MAG: M28 family metallopeptidase [Dehalococcoidia bacterium]|nr:M28 family metallopeptidase [Dehalococcoidia bacterium]